MMGVSAAGITWPERDGAREQRSVTLMLRYGNQCTAPRRKGRKGKQSLLVSGQTHVTPYRGSAFYEPDSQEAEPSCPSLRGAR